MTGYENLRNLLCEVEDINNELLFANDFGKMYKPMELRHILWYVDEAKNGIWDYRGGGTIAEDIIRKIDLTIPLSSQDEVCQKIYEYLNDL